MKTYNFDFEFENILSFLFLLLIVWPALGGFISSCLPSSCPAPKHSQLRRDNPAARSFLTPFLSLSPALILLIEFTAAAVLTSGFILNPILNILNLNIYGLSLNLNFTLDGFRAVYVLIIAYMWFETTLFTPEYLTVLHNNHNNNNTHNNSSAHNDNSYYIFVLMTLSAVMGLFLSADLYTAFVFFEIMSLTSCVMVVHDETEQAVNAAKTYIAVAIIGGLATFTGLALLNNLLGTLNISELHNAVNVFCRNHTHDGGKGLLYVSGLLIFSGFAAKAAVFPAHIWLPTAHTVAPAPSSALLSGVLTKSGLFGVLILTSQIFTGDFYWGMFLLILALITMLLGAVLAVFSVNIKRTLACSSMSQIGFILTGVAMQCLLSDHNDLAVRGTVLYMIGHSLIKLVLFLDAGVIHMNTHVLDLNGIRGFGRGKGLFMFTFTAAGLGLMGMPLLNGYIGKTLIHEAIVECISISQYEFLFKCVEWVFLISGALTTSYMLKLFVMLFIAKPVNIENHTEKSKKYLSFINSAFLLFSSLILVLIGVLPYKAADTVSFIMSDFLTVSETSHHHVINYFSFEALEGAAISIGLGIMIFFVFVKNVLMRNDANGEPVCLDVWPKWLNIEYLIYRPLVLQVLPFIGALFARVTDLILSGPVTLILSRASRQRFVQSPENVDFGFYHDLSEEPEQSLKTLLPSSLAYSLMTFIFGLLFVFAYLVL